MGVLLESSGVAICEEGSVRKDFAEGFWACFAVGSSDILDSSEGGPAGDVIFAIGKLLVQRMDGARVNKSQARRMPIRCMEISQSVVVDGNPVNTT